MSTLQALERFAAQVGDSLAGGDTLLLTGPLGAGKTTFVQHLARHLGVAERITSPTFTLMHLHQADHPRLRQLVHIDAYRLAGPAEFAAIGVEDYIGKPGVVTVVEWADNVDSFFSKYQVRRLRFFVKKEQRYIEMK